MQKTLSGKNIALLVASGFNESDVVDSQKALMRSGAKVSVVGMEPGLVNSWNGEGWGLNFIPDRTLSRALAADYSVLIVPGGERSLRKLTQTAHTKRFLGGFLDAGKPVVLFDDAVTLLGFAERAPGRTLGGPAKLREEIQRLGAFWQDEPLVYDGSLMTGRSVENRSEFIAAMTAFISGGVQDAMPMPVDKAA